MNKKTIFFFRFFLLTSIIALSQTNKQYAKAKISYSVKTYIDKKLPSYKFLQQRSPELLSKRETIASEFDFSLVFNDSTSLFYLEQKLYSDNNAANMALIDAAYFGRIRQETNNFITEELQEDFGKFLVARSYQEWKLHDETKTIGDYVCFKATTFYTTTNPKGKVFTHNYTAWYTPQLPYKFGPAGFGNLPGLIIELQGEKATYGVKKIVFYDDEQIKENKMPELKRKKLITEVEFEKLAAEDEKRWLNKN
ncbi:MULTISPECIES: GLPGLI family protein [unclassified Polaribacter]|uniref:GLPGLI family protein n=1 Tax=unclassified Polaribacter TaxID=196858 RepID=UPI0011BE0F0E|nr:MULTISPECIES: GLPGLI family protein [unclassified Polaribacter]TXD54211.1 GLPGLI family protein [Polaribacter sp. IC063]TXD62476.1 GLPGLI family protein [Polaribacter sp. IC066]